MGEARVKGFRGDGLQSWGVNHNSISSYSSMKLNEGKNEWR